MQHVIQIKKILIIKKLRYKMDCYILHKVLLVIMLLFVITTIFNRYVKHRSKLTKTTKMENNDF